MARPTKYQDTFPERAAALAANGATDAEIARGLGIATSTFYDLKNLHHEFSEAIKAAKEPADERVEKSLYDRAVGYWYTETQAIKVKTGQNKEEVQLVEVERFMPPESTAMIFWLKNRRKDEWRDKHEVEHSASGDLAGLLLEARTRSA